MKKLYNHLLIVSIVICGIYSIGWMVMPEGSLIDRSLATIAYPLVYTKKKLVDGYEACVRFVTVCRKSDELVSEYQKKYEDLQAQYLALLGTVTAWEDSKELMQFERRYKTHYALTVDVISKQFSSAEHCYLIEGGKNKGIERDMVAVYKNCLVGRVSEVYDRYSKIMLITDPHCKVAALCRTSLDRGIHEGIGSLQETQLSYVFDTQMDVEKRLQKNDYVISSGDGLVFPKGFGLGTIIEYKKNDLHVDIRIKPLLDFKHLNYCCIIAKGAELNEVDFAGEPIKQENPADVLLKKLESNEKKEQQPVAEKVAELKPISPEVINAVGAATTVVEPVAPSNEAPLHTAVEAANVQNVPTIEQPHIDPIVPAAPVVEHVE
jgi:rod shape-determining protein MreC